MFQLIKNINADDEVSWVDKIFLTFDVDWAYDAIIEDTINLIEEFDISSTWFVTHSGDYLSKLRKNKNFEEVVNLCMKF